MGLLGLISLLAIGCTPAEMRAWWRPPEKIRFLTPSTSGAVVTDTIPVLVRVPKRLADGSATLSLDGRPAGDAGVLRRRWWSGKQADYISALSTDGLSPGPHTLSLSISDGHGETWTVERRFEFAPRPDSVRLRLVDAHGQPRSGATPLEGLAAIAGPGLGRNRRRWDRPTLRRLRKASVLIPPPKEVMILKHAW